MCVGVCVCMRACVCTCACVPVCLHVPVCLRVFTPQFCALVVARAHVFARARVCACIYTSILTNFMCTDGSIGLFFVCMSVCLSLFLVRARAHARSLSQSLSLSVCVCLRMRVCFINLLLSLCVALCCSAL